MPNNTIHPEFKEIAQLYNRMTSLLIEMGYEVFAQKIDGSKINCLETAIKVLKIMEEICHQTETSSPGPTNRINERKLRQMVRESINQETKDERQRLRDENLYQVLDEVNAIEHTHFPAGAAQFEVEENVEQVLSGIHDIEEVHHFIPPSTEEDLANVSAPVEFDENDLNVSLTDLLDDEEEEAAFADANATLHDITVPHFVESDPDPLQGPSTSYRSPQLHAGPSTSTQHSQNRQDILGIDRKVFNERLKKLLEKNEHWRAQTFSQADWPKTGRPRSNQHTYMNNGQKSAPLKYSKWSYSPDDLTK